MPRKYKSLTEVGGHLMAFSAGVDRHLYFVEKLASYAVTEGELTPFGKELLALFDKYRITHDKTFRGILVSVFATPRKSIPAKPSTATDG